MRVVLTVPHYSQHLNVSDYWKPRSCAIACAKMVLDSAKKKAPYLNDLVLETEKEYGYDTSYGWAHETILRVLDKYGVSAERREYKTDALFEIGVSEICEALESGNPVMISTIKKWEEEGKFHMVLFVGYEKNGTEIEGFYYHDPDVEEAGIGENLFVSFDRFKKYWRRLAIFPKV